MLLSTDLPTGGSRGARVGTAALGTGLALVPGVVDGDLSTPVSGDASNRLPAPQDVGNEAPGTRQKIIQYTGGAWKQVSTGDYLCDSLVSTGIGN